MVRRSQSWTPRATLRASPSDAVTSREGGLRQGTQMDDGIAVKLIPNSHFQARH
ncbi:MULTISPECIES: hypothetical protein [Fischerella]|uniref:hypothetical protein n=1 Tax=Fischerella TaxID=1190 RepID=UPI0015E090EB|nr:MULTISPECIES: hypothetical protein [Fischerella]